MNEETFKNLAQEILGTENITLTKESGMKYYTLITKNENQRKMKLHLILRNQEPLKLGTWDKIPPIQDLTSIIAADWDPTYKEYAINLYHPNSIQEAQEFVKRWKNNNKSLNKQKLTI